MSRASDISSLTRLNQVARGALTTGGDVPTGDRAVARAKRDYQVMMRGVDRELQRVSVGVVGDTGEKLKTLRDTFQQTLDATLDELSAGKIDYMTFAERMAAARITLRHDFAGAAGTSGTTDGTGSSTTRVGEHHSRSRHAHHAHGHEDDHGEDDDGAPRGLRRASRDVRILLRHVDRDVARLTSDNSALADQAGAMRDEFAKNVKKAFDEFAASGAEDYSGFAQHLVVMRREFMHALADLSGPPAATTGGATGVASGGSSTTVTPDPGAGTTGATGTPLADTEPVADATQGAQGGSTSAGSATGATAGSAGSSSTPRTPGERAARDRELLFSRLDAEMSSLLPQLTLFPDAARYKEMAEGFRSFVQDRVEGFLSAGGTDYSSLAQELAGARMRLSSGVRAMLSGNPKIDVHG